MDNLFDTSTKPASSGIQIGLAKANSDKPYLGDPAVVSELVRAFIHTIASSVGQTAWGSLTREDSIKTIDLALVELADTLAGKNEEYETAGNWNPAGVADYVRTVLGENMSAEATDDLEAIKQACALLCRDVYDALGELNNDASPDDVTLALEGIAGDFTNLFVGLPVDGDSQLQQEPSE